MLVILNYHYIRESFEAPHPSIFGITPGGFRSQLELLATQGEFISLTDLASAISADTALPERSLLVTFDDALREQYEIARPILRQLGIPAVYFANTSVHQNHTVSTVHMIHLLRSRLAPEDFLREVEKESRRLGIHPGPESVDTGQARRQYSYDSPRAAAVKYYLNFQLSPRQQTSLIRGLFTRLWPESEQNVSQNIYMDVEQLKSLCTEQSLGSHGHEHLPMGKLSAAEFQKQLQMSWELLDQWGHRGPRTFAFPYGSTAACSPLLRTLAPMFDMVAGFTMERRANETISDPLFLARYSNDDLPGGAHPNIAMDNLFTHTCPVASEPNR